MKMNKNKTRTLCIVYSIQSNKRTPTPTVGNLHMFINHSPKSLSSRDIILVFDSYTLGHMVDLVHSHQARGKFELLMVR